MFSRMTCGFAGIGWRVSLIAPERGQVPEMPPGAEFHPVRCVHGYLNRLRQSGRVLPLLRKLKPDAVLFPDPDLMGAMLRFRREGRAAVVFDRHENFEQRWAVHRAANMADAVLGRVYPAYERYAVRRLDGVIVVFEEMRRAIPNGVPTCVAHNYPTRADLAALAAPPAPATPHYTAVFVGTFARAYGHLQLLELAHELVNARGRREFTLFVAGQFDGGLAEEAQGFIAQHALEQNVTLKPERIPHEEVIALVAASRIGICPLSREAALKNSLHNKMLEFMAAGLPVIASDVRPGGRIISECGCGKLFWAEDVQEIARTVEHWLDHPEEAKALGARGQRLALDKLVWESELALLAPWLEQQIAKRAG
jgi:glycosyltransferase involved in cell wall biosynthesis